MPSHADVTFLFQKHLPLSIGATREVSFLYHVPRNPSYNPAFSQVSSIILSRTPTQGFYAALNDHTYRDPPLCFLHRPWNLDRRAVQRDALILSSHTSFDEHLTVGWNVPLAQRLALDVDNAVCIQSYKGNRDRKIGLVAAFATASTVPLEDLVSILHMEYDGSGALHDPTQIGDQLAEDNGGKRLPSRIKAVAIMNAFHEEEIHRVLSTARKQRWLEEDEDGRKILYLTGAARDYGLEAARKVGMPAFCVGHSACEEWGIRYLATEMKKEWLNLDVVEVLEEEEECSAESAKHSKVE